MAEGHIVNQYDPVPPAVQMQAELRTDEAGAAGYQNPHGRAVADQRWGLAVSPHMNT